MREMYEGCEKHADQRGDEYDDAAGTRSSPVGRSGNFGLSILTGHSISTLA